MRLRELLSGVLMTLRIGRVMLVSGKYPFRTLFSAVASFDAEQCGLRCKFLAMSFLVFTKPLKPT